MESLLRTMTFDFFGKGMHKISHDLFFKTRDAVLLDVRTLEEMDSVSFPLKYHSGHTMQIPLNELPDRLEEVPKNRPVAVLCVSDVRSAMAYLYLQSNGYNQARILEGGIVGLAEKLKPGAVHKHIANCSAGKDQR